MSEIRIRPAVPADHEECGRILYAAFADIADRHGFPCDFASEDMAKGILGAMVEGAFGVVAERDRRILGSNFLHEGDPVAAVGPISVDPELQQSGVGRLLMQAVIERGQQSQAVRLVQDAFNRTSMALYASLGFEVREPLVLIGGTPRGPVEPDIEVRPLGEEDVETCATLCQKVHGITRTHELRRAAGGLKPYVALRDGRITAYASTVSIWFVAHGVAETDRDMQALLLGSAADGGQPLSFLLPTRQASLFRWALGQGLRIVKPLTLMTLGPYQEPRGSFFPTVLY